MGTSLAAKSALVLGAGGLGGPALLVLAGGGVGRVWLADEGPLETAELTRQPLCVEADLGQRRATAVARQLARRYPAVQVEVVDPPADAASALALARQADLVVDASGEVATQFLANDAAVAAGRPLVHGGVLRCAAQLLTVLPGSTGCLRCLFEAPPPPGSIPSCAEAGLLGPLAGLAGALMGAEALRLLGGGRGSYAGRLLVLESRRARWRTVPVARRTGCPSCAAPQEAR